MLLKFALSFFWSVDTTDVGHCVVTITSRINWFLDLFCKHHSFTRPLAYFEIRIFLSQADQATSAPVFTCGLTFGLFFWKLKRIILSGPSSSQGRKAGAEGSKRQAKQRSSRLHEGQVQCTLAVWGWPRWWQRAARLPAASLWPFLLNKQQRRSSTTVLGRVLYIVIEES